MRFSVPITITKAGAPATPHLIKQYIGGDFDNDYLGYVDASGNVFMLMVNGEGIVLYGDNSFQVEPLYDDESFNFIDTDSDVAQATAGEFNWKEVGTSLYYNDWDGVANVVFKITDPVSHGNLLMAYDICMNMDDNSIELPVDVFVPEIHVDLATAFVTSCEVGGRSYLALSVNDVVRPIYDVRGNGGCQMAADGGTFNVQDCQEVGAAGASMPEMPLQAALANYWRPRSCSIDGVLVTTFLTIEVYMLGSDFIINSEVITETAGTWYIPTSQFTVTEA